MMQQSQPVRCKESPVWRGGPRIVLSLLSGLLVLAFSHALYAAFGGSDGRPSLFELIQDAPPAGEAKQSPWPLFPDAPAGPSGENVALSQDDPLDNAMLVTALADFEQKAARAWGTNFAARAPYPYYTNFSTINSLNREVCRPAWMEWDYSYMYSGAQRRGNRIRLTNVLGLSSWALDYSQWSVDQRADEIQWFKGYLGFSLPLVGGYFDVSAGGSWIDNHADLHGKLSYNGKGTISVYPIWPLGVIGSYDYGHFAGGHEVVDWEILGKVQVWRAAFFEVGWRDVTTLRRSDAFHTDGVFVGVSLSFSNLKTIFYPPENALADGLFGLF